MGDCCRLGLIGPPDPDSAETWYRKAAAQNHTGALVMLAEALSRAETQTEESLAEIFGLWLAAADSGHAMAERKVGICYLLGAGCLADPVAAVQWLSLAAEQEDSEAEYELGLCYRKGLGFKKDQKSARFWIGRALEHGYTGEAASAPPPASAEETPVETAPTSQMGSNEGG
jgi:TPR repeat protein